MPDRIQHPGMRLPACYEGPKELIENLPLHIRCALWAFADQNQLRSPWETVYRLHHESERYALEMSTHVLATTAEKEIEEPCYKVYMPRWAHYLLSSFGQGPVPYQNLKTFIAAYGDPLYENAITHLYADYYGNLFEDTSRKPHELIRVLEPDLWKVLQTPPRSPLDYQKPVYWAQLTRLRIRHPTQKTLVSFPPGFDGAT